jgi:hypothetical protein
MTAYQLFYIENGSAVRSVDLEAEDDQDAKSQFIIRREEAYCELWCGQRIVRAYPK